MWAITVRNFKVGYMAAVLICFKELVIRLHKKYYNSGLCLQNCKALVRIEKCKCLPRGEFSMSSLPTPQSRFTIGICIIGPTIVCCQPYDFIRIVYYFIVTDCTLVFHGHLASRLRMFISFSLHSPTDICQLKVTILASDSGPKTTKAYATKIYWYLRCYKTLCWFCCNWLWRLPFGSGILF